MSLLVSHHSLEGALSVLSNLLKKLKDLIFLSVAEYNSIRAAGLQKLLEELFESCNFGVRNPMIITLYYNVMYTSTRALV